MASKTGTLYTGLTSNIKKRVWEHKNHVVPGFSDKYKAERLLYYETIGDSLSVSINPQWADLSREWYDKSKDD